MERWPQFSSGYLLLLVFWWTVVLVLFRAMLHYGIYDLRGPLCFIFAPIAMGAALGRLVVRMLNGFIVGCAISGAI